MFTMLVNSKTESHNITDIVTSATWSGNYNQAARKLEFSVAVSPTDRFLPQPFIGVGNMVKFFTSDGVERFRGYVFTKEKSSNGSEMEVTAYDGGIYLLKSKATFNFKKMLPAQVAKKVCGEVGVPTGQLANPGTVVSFIADGETIYDIIMTAYTYISKLNGAKYMAVMNDGKLNVIQKGKAVVQYALSPTIEPNSTLISDSTYNESIENMVNRVKIYDDKQNQIGKVENAEWIKDYGVLQDIYTKEQNKNPNTVAKNMLRGLGRTASIEGLGDIECVTGRAVRVKEPYTGLDGLFFIDEDEHKFQDGQHTMNLELSFQNMMDEKDEV
jgi:hypothetical protein